jgi:ABC-type lipoprotein export system ATPase subunit
LLFADEPTGNLDSVTSKEILAMFQQLNREEGLTIILVTHDSNVGRYAKRTIHMQDGLIQDGVEIETELQPFLPGFGTSPEMRGAF